MGNSFAKLLKEFGLLQKEMRIVMVGLDAAGKTTILYKIKLDEVVETIPTIGFNVEKVKFGKVDFEVWDIGGQDKIRPLWRHYYYNAHGIVFVVDSSDRERVSDARDELLSLLKSDELRDAVLLVYGNKQDMPGAMSPAELTDKLGLHELYHRDWYVQGACATRGEGLNEGLQWMTKALKKRF